MSHNEQIRLQGKCNCPCHFDRNAKCTCGASKIKDWPILPKHKRLRSEKLTSRVKPFNKQRSHTAYSSQIIAVSKGHKVHEPYIRRSTK